LSGDQAYRVLHLVLVGSLFAVFVVQIEKRIFQGPAGLMIVIALALGALFAYGLYKRGFVKQLLDVLTPAPIVFLVLFIFFSDTHKLIFPAKDANALGVKVSSNTPVVEVVFDEFPTATIMNDSGKGIDAKRFPGFAQLARQSTWYRDNSTVADFTGRAVPAIETGVNPDWSTLPISSDQPNSIFSLLGGQYGFNVVEPRDRRLPTVALRQRRRSGPPPAAHSAQATVRRPLGGRKEADPAAGARQQAARRQRHLRQLRQQRRQWADRRQFRPGPLRASQPGRVPALGQPNPQWRAQLQLHPHGAAARALPFPARRP